jgi:transcriptional regulator with XRE-family HTH domain
VRETGWTDPPSERCGGTEKEDTLEEADKNDPDARLALVLFRHSLLLDQARFAGAARIAPSQLSVYERGERGAPREVLEKAAAAAGFPVHLLDSLLWGLRSFRAAVRGRSRVNRALADGIAVELIALVRSAIDVALEPLPPAPGEVTAKPAAGDRAAAAALWASMAECTPAERRMLVEELDEYQTWALCEQVAAESARKAPDHPGEALELAVLALLIAERIAGEPEWSLRVQGYAWAHVGNARRACGDPAGAEEAFRRARQLWEAGAAGDPGLLSEASISALLRKA